MRPEKMLADKEEIKKMLPQKEPFVMVDCLYESEEKFIRTGFRPTEKNIFSENGYFTEPGLIENMAQSAAAGTGYFFTAQQKAIPTGFIGAIKDFQLFRLPEVNALLETEIRVVAEVMNASVISAKVSSCGELLASCEMKIFLLDPPPIT
jgi:3-hydroxyacyl-[acyl-carrier-protein] dehydratase